MKSRNVIILAAALPLLFSCAILKPEPGPSYPQLVSLSPMPELPDDVLELEMNVIFHIAQDGTVKHLKILNSSGYQDWDKAAADSMKNWRFVTLEEDSLWIRRTVKAQFEEERIFNLGEIIASDKQTADSLYTALREGHSFNDILNNIQNNELLHTEARILEQMPISMYPQNVREKLRKLHEGDYTKPIQVGDRYIIYKRLKNNNSLAVH